MLGFHLPREGIRLDSYRISTLLVCRWSAVVSWMTGNNAEEMFRRKTLLVMLCSHKPWPVLLHWAQCSFKTLCAHHRTKTKQNFSTMGPTCNHGYKWRWFVAQGLAECMTLVMSHAHLMWVGLCCAHAWWPSRGFQGPASESCSELT